MAGTGKQTREEEEMKRKEERNEKHSESCIKTRRTGEKKEKETFSTL